MGDEEAGSKAMAYSIYGKELADRLALEAGGDGRRKNYRLLFEPTDATTQCEKSDHPFSPGMTCYICGIEIPSKASLDNNPKNELYPECEHVLPLTQGRWFLDVYMNTRESTDPWSVEARRLEYDYAHRVCNQAKGVNSFAKSAGHTIRVDPSRIKAILKDIHDRARADIVALEQEGESEEAHIALLARIRDAVQGRTKDVTARVEAIQKHIDSEPITKDPDLHDIGVLIRTTLMADPGAMPKRLREIHDKWYAGRGPAKEALEKALTAFRASAVAKYPNLVSPAGLAKTLAILFPRAGGLAVDGGTIDAVLEKLYMGGISVETVLQFHTAYLYGICMTLYSGMPKTKSPSELQCDLVRILEGSRDQEKTQSTEKVSISESLFGPVPTDIDKAKCQAIASSRRREDAGDKYRVQAEANDTPTIEDDTRFILREVYETIYPQLPDSIYGLFKIYLTRKLESVVRSYLRSVPKIENDEVWEASKRVVAVLNAYIGPATGDMAYSEKLQRAYQAHMRDQTIRGGRRKTHRRRRARKTLRKRVRA